ncbi:hypothetical protein D3C86_1983800 [compost metagenome]
MFGLGLFQNALQASLHAADEAQPAFQFGGVVVATDPAADEQGEQTLELRAVVRGIAQDIQCFGFFG